MISHKKVGGKLIITLITMPNNNNDKLNKKGYIQTIKDKAASWFVQTADDSDSAIMGLIDEAAEEKNSIKKPPEVDFHD